MENLTRTLSLSQHDERNKPIPSFKPSAGQAPRPPTQPPPPGKIKPLNLWPPPNQGLPMSSRGKAGSINPTLTVPERERGNIDNHNTHQEKSLSRTRKKRDTSTLVKQSGPRPLIPSLPPSRAVCRSKEATAPVRQQARPSQQNAVPSVRSIIAGWFAFPFPPAIPASFLGGRQAVTTDYVLLPMLGSQLLLFLGRLH